MPWRNVRDQGDDSAFVVLFLAKFRFEMPLLVIVETKIGIPKRATFETTFTMIT